MYNRLSNFRFSYPANFLCGYRAESPYLVSPDMDSSMFIGTPPRLSGTQDVEIRLYFAILVITHDVFSTDSRQEMDLISAARPLMRAKNSDGPSAEP